MTEHVALFAMAAVAVVLRIVSGGALPPSPAPAEFVPGSAIKAGYRGEWITVNP